MIDCNKLDIETCKMLMQAARERIDELQWRIDGERWKKVNNHSRNSKRKVYYLLSELHKSEDKAALLREHLATME